MQPILFTLWGQPVYAYVVGTGLGYTLGAVIGVALGRRDQRPLVDLVETAVVVVLSALLGSKIFHVLFEAKGHVLSSGGVATGRIGRTEPLFKGRPRSIPCETALLLRLTVR